jgi:hypothetical protein
MESVLYMNRKHQKTLAAIFAEPTRANISWDAVVSALAAKGVEIISASGSRFVFAYGGTSHVVHRPHPGNELKKPGVRAVRYFCIAAGIGPE